MKIAGVYSIYNNKSKRTYIGSSKNIANRFKNHISSLKSKKHHNINLQLDWNSYKKCDFEFKILEETSPEDCLNVEQKYIDVADFNKLYNIKRIAQTQHYKKKKESLYLLNLKGEIIDKAKNGVELCKKYNLGRQLNYTYVNTKTIKKRIYRIVTCSFYESNKDLIKSWKT
jgi:group I intron endonuclease